MAKRQKKQFTKRLLDAINVPKMICDHCFGTHHTHAHRIVIGFLVMGIGAVMAAMTEHILIVNVLTVMTDKLCDGIGVVPIIDYVNKAMEDQE